MKHKDKQKFFKIGMIIVAVLTAIAFIVPMISHLFIK